MRKSVILFRVHEDNRFSRDGLAKLRRELPRHRIEVVSYSKIKIQEIGVFENGYMVDADDLHRLPYDLRLKTFNPDNSRNYNDLPVMHFFRSNPDFDFYWIVEFDVYYSGHWNDLFEALAASDADLLGTTIVSRAHYPQWVHWEGLRFHEEPLDPGRYVKSFLPFARLSRAALAAIDAAYVRGTTGHPEGTWPTTCTIRDLMIEDIGGNGAYTPEKWKNKHYWNTPSDPYIAPGTFVFRPSFTRAAIDATVSPAMLWHPVKS